MADELAEINGIKPKVVLDDGEERELASQTRYVTRWLDSKDASETVAQILVSLPTLPQLSSREA